MNLKSKPFASATLPALTIALSVAGLSTQSARADATWVGDTSQDWNNAANWSSDPANPTGNFFINTATGNFPTLGASSAFTPVDLVLGDGTGNSGRFDQSSGALSLAVVNASGNWMFVGRGGGTGTYNLTGDASITVGKLHVGGGYYVPGGNGTVTVNTSGILTATSTAAYGYIFGGSGYASINLGVGDFGANLGTGTLNLQNGTINAAGEVWVGSFGGTGTLNMTGGTLNATYLTTCRWVGTGTVSIANATANVAAVANCGAGAATDVVKGTINVNGGGIVNSEGDVTLAYAGSGTNGAFGTMNIASGGVVNVATTTERWVIVNQYDTIPGTLNVSGTLNLNANTDLRFSTGGSTGTSVVNLNAGAITSYSGNQTGTLTSGDLDLNWGGGASANNTFNLNGGVLTIRAVVTGSDNGTAVFNFNGGTLKAANTNEPNFLNLGGASQRANVRDGGAIIDTNGYDVTIAQPLLHSDVGGDAATDGGLVKNGAGKLTLTGANGYNGNTTVNGGTLGVNGSSLSDTGKLSINGGGVVEPSGSEVVDKLYFDGVAQASGTWGASGSGATHIDNVRFAGTAGVVSVTSAGGALTYSDWADLKGLSVSNRGAAEDPDHDGISNALEFVLGGNPLASDAANLPTVTTDATNFIFTFNRSDDSEAEVALTFQYGSNLTGWTDVAIGPVDAAPVFVVENGAAPDTVAVFIPKSNAVGGKLFGRLKATK
ncbi:autotransporter-associated beta strand repeat-containing protein [Luteolibacter sp. LG18]|uniref:autotransporter outer membrane beta-barrel domain-containing protein n=1 Tax=Luteolibacter sp. LG18 TaxID=2819286 RepID=UPI002B304DA1|nr:hypothetical protein llg_40700 [Luteolibacter sp. LG18]